MITESDGNKILAWFIEECKDSLISIEKPRLEEELRDLLTELHGRT
jgi:hypothetical protein